MRVHACKTFRQTGTTQTYRALSLVSLSLSLSLSVCMSVCLSVCLSLHLCQSVYCIRICMAIVCNPMSCTVSYVYCIVYVCSEQLGVARQRVGFSKSRVKNFGNGTKIKNKCIAIAVALVIYVACLYRMQTPLYKPYPLPWLMLAMRCASLAGGGNRHTTYTYIFIIYLSVSRVPCGLAQSARAGTE